MKKKKKEKPKDEKESQAASSELSDFYELLGTLLPQSSKLLRDSLENYKERLDSKPAKVKDETTFLLELEKEKNKCMLELLGISIDQYQRVSADYANFQKRGPKQIADTILYEKEKIIKTLLPALDNFESALGGLQNTPTAENIETIVKGIQIIYNQMLDILKSHGVERIKALGEKFDPALHQAMMQQTQPDREENIVLEEFQTGYKLNGRVLRPSKVIVNKLPSEQPAQQQEAESPEQTTDENETADAE